MRRALALFAAMALAACSTANDGMAVNSVSETAPPAIAHSASPVDAIAHDYVQLTLAMGEKEPGYVDAYYGPPEWAAAAKTDPRSLVELGNDIVRLMERLDALPPPESEPEGKRRAFLSAQLEAAATRHAMISGEVLPFAREAKGLFGVDPVLAPLEDFDPVLAEVEELIPGTGPLAERVEAYRNRFVIPKDRLKPVFDAAIAECKRRTAEYIDLPPGESFVMEFVTGKSWSGYNYYQGNYKSLIQINTDLPIYISRAVDLGCHEGYPGHHVYNMLLEKNLVNDRGWTEFSVYPLYSPQSLIAEGSANYGIALAFDGEERLEYERDLLFPLAGFDPKEAGRYNALTIALDALSGARFTIAQGYLDKEIPRDDAIALAQKYLLVSEARARQMMDFNDQYRSYVINYGLGQELVRAHIEAAGDAPFWRWQAMEKLLSEPVLPGDLVGDTDS